MIVTGLIFTANHVSSFQSTQQFDSFTKQSYNQWLKRK